MEIIDYQNPKWVLRLIAKRLVKEETSRTAEEWQVKGYEPRLSRIYPNLSYFYVRSWHLYAEKM